MIRLV